MHFVFGWIAIFAYVVKHYILDEITSPAQNTKEKKVEKAGECYLPPIFCSYKALSSKMLCPKKSKAYL